MKKDFLSKIVEQKKQEIDDAKKRTPIQTD
jgi:hypothetical protein